LLLQDTRRRHESAFIPQVQLKVLIAWLKKWE